MTGERIRVEITARQVVRYSRILDLPIEQFHRWEAACEVRNYSEQSRLLNSFAEDWLEPDRVHDWEDFDDVEVTELRPKPEAAP